MTAFVGVAVGNRDAHVLMVWTVYQVCSFVIERAGRTRISHTHRHTQTHTHTYTHTHTTTTHTHAHTHTPLLHTHDDVVRCWQCNGDDQKLVEALISKCDHA